MAAVSLVVVIAASVGRITAAGRAGVDRAAGDVRDSGTADSLDSCGNRAFLDSGL
jgi:hypothetical protein